RIRFRTHFSKQSAKPKKSAGTSLSNRQNQRRVRALLLAIGKTKEECGHFSQQSAKRKKSAGTPLRNRQNVRREGDFFLGIGRTKEERSEEHTSELQSPDHLVC